MPMRRLPSGANRMNVPIWGGVVCSFGAALRACGALPRAPACWERSANRVVSASHAEAFGTPSFVSWGRPIEATRPGGVDPQDGNRVTEPVGQNQRAGHGRSWLASALAHAELQPVRKTRSAEGLGGPRPSSLGLA